MSSRDKSSAPPKGAAPPEPPPATALPERVAEPAVSPEEERLRAELAALQDRHLRLQAEFENYRKRQQRDRDEANRLSRERILIEITGVLDNLERALSHASAAEAQPESLTQGVELVGRQIREVLARFGAVPISSLGEPFDPRLHEAMARVDTSGDPPDGTVVEEYRRGYLLDGKVLRPAMVAVAKQIDEDGDQAS